VSDSLPSAEARPFCSGYLFVVAAVWMPDYTLGCSEVGVPCDFVSSASEADSHLAGYKARSEPSMVTSRVGQTSICLPPRDKNMHVRGGAPGVGLRVGTAKGRLGEATLRLSPTGSLAQR